MDIQIKRKAPEKDISGDRLIEIDAVSPEFEALWSKMSQGTVGSTNRYWPHQYYNAKFLPCSAAYRTDRRGYRTFELNEGGMNLSWLRTVGIEEGITITLESGVDVSPDREFENMIRRMRRNIHKVWTELHGGLHNLESRLLVDGEEASLHDRENLSFGQMETTNTWGMAE